MNNTYVGDYMHGCLQEWVMIYVSDYMSELLRNQWLYM